MHQSKIFRKLNFRLQTFSDSVEVHLDDIVKIFSNDNIIKYDTHKSIRSTDIAHKYLTEAIMGYETQVFYDYFLFDEKDNRLIGIIKLLSPRMVERYYPTMNNLFKGSEENQSVWAIEYYLVSDYWRKGLMSFFVNECINELFNQGATTICAYMHPENWASTSLLKKLSFMKVLEYTSTQGFELWYLKKNMASSHCIGKIFFANDHELFINAVQMIIEKKKNFKTVGRSYNFAETFEKINDSGANILFTDDQMPKTDFINDIHKLKKMYPDLKIIVHTWGGSERNLNKIINQINGYIDMGAHESHLHQIFEKVNNGETFFVKTIFSKDHKDENSFFVTDKRSDFLSFVKNSLDYL